jgi:hypothetical protein
LIAPLEKTTQDEIVAEIAKRVFVKGDIGYENAGGSLSLFKGRDNPVDTEELLKIIEQLVKMKSGE